MILKCIKRKPKLGKIDFLKIEFNESSILFCFNDIYFTGSFLNYKFFFFFNFKSSSFVSLQ